MVKPTLELLPDEVYALRQDVKSILKFLEEHGNFRQSSNQTEKFLTVPQAAEFLNLATQTVYGLIHRKQIPCFKRQKRVYFSKPDLTAWLESGRLKTHDEIAAECHPTLIRRSVHKKNESSLINLN
jgi:excisionase family DNA binding protein